MKSKGDRRRFYCEACGHWVEGTRDDIKNHNGTALHRKNTERKLKERHADARRQKIKDGKAAGEDHLIPLEKTHGEKKKEEKKKKMIDALKRVAEKEAKKRESDSALMAKSISLKAIGGMGEQGKMWDIVIDEETGKACFMNILSGEKKFEKPFGLKLSEEDQEFWERCQANQIDWREVPTVAGLNTKVGAWEEVAPEESFFNKFAFGEPVDNDINEEVDFVKPQEQRFDTILDKAEGNIEKALESMMSGKDKSKNFIELAKRNIDLDFAEEESEPKIPKTQDDEQANSGPVVFKRKGGDARKKKSGMAMDLEDD